MSSFLCNSIFRPVWKSPHTQILDPPLCATYLVRKSSSGIVRFLTNTIIQHYSDRSVNFHILSVELQHTRITAFLQLRLMNRSAQKSKLMCITAALQDHRVQAVMTLRFTLPPLIKLSNAWMLSPL